MNKFTLVVSNLAKRKLKNISSKYYHKIYKSLECIEQNPYQGKLLTAEFREIYSYKAWPYRILYKIYKKQLMVFVIDIGHRKDVYK